MPLPNAHLGIVEREKLVDYLLNSAHPDNGGKAQFFTSLGFSREDPQTLVGALRTLAQTSEVVESTRSPHGEKYVVDGYLSSQTEGSQRRRVRTVWIINRGSDVPRLVTAYPVKE